MEIKAKCRFDRESLRAVAHLSSFKKRNPKTCLAVMLIWAAIIMAIILLEIAFFGMDGTLVLLAVVDFLVIGLELFLYFGLPVVQFNSLKRLKYLENEYLFTDHSLKSYAKSESYFGESEIEYSALVKAYETTKYFFLFQTARQVLVVDKATLEGGSPKEIREKLQSYLGKKYVLCNY